MAKAANFVALTLTNLAYPNIRQTYDIVVIRRMQYIKNNSLQRSNKTSKMYHNLNSVRLYFRLNLL